MFITKVVIEVKRVGQLDANKKIYYNLPGATSLFSSLEGHALLLLQGYGFMVKYFLNRTYKMQI
jgi:hypothetical protein